MKTGNDIGNGGIPTDSQGELMPLQRRIPTTWAALILSTVLSAQPVAVRQMEGQLRGFLVLRTLNGEIVADGDSLQVTHGGQITNHLTFHFKDGSLQDETVVFTQNGHFRVLSDHLVQKGPTFKHPMDVAINAATGQVTVTYTDDKGQQKVDRDQLKLPPDLVNGIVPVVLKNLPPGQQSIIESMVVATPKPMLIKLAMHVESEDSFSTGSASHKATRYQVHVDIGGIKGVLAPIIGKQPPDTRVWISEGSCSSFLKSEGPSYEGGPIWRTELVSPVWQDGITGMVERKGQPR
jgi:hypothetical protein